MPAAAKKKAPRVMDDARAVLDLVSRVAVAFERMRGDDDDDDDDDRATQYERARDEALADVLDGSEEAQSILAAVLTHRAKSKELHKKIASGNADASAEAAVILRALAAHSQAESVRSLMESPDLGHVLNIEETGEDETMPHEWGDDDDGGGDDD